MVRIRSDLARTHRDRHRRVLASVLRSAAKLFLLIDNVEQHDQLLRETESLRDRLAKNVSSLRTMSEVVEYEFGVDREQHIRSSELILQISITAAALIWNQVAVLHDGQGIDFLAETWTRGDASKTGGPSKRPSGGRYAEGFLV